jgi:DNA-binding IclR family transcriptional regulator
MCALAMPLRNKDGDVIAALGLGLRPDRADEPAFVEESLAEVAKTAEAINGLMRQRG